MERYYINTMGNDDDAYREAMQFACELVNNGMEVGTVILLARTKRTVGWLKRLYGDDVVKKLFTGVKFENCLPTFLIQTVRSYTNFTATSDIVIAMGLDDGDLMKLDDYDEVKAIISIPWLRENVQRWVSTWSPTEIRTNQQAERFPSPEPVVQIALRELTSNINLSTGIHHGHDNDRAKMYIRALNKYSTLDGNTVMAFLVRELGWDSDHANDVKKLIDTLNAGKYFQGGQRTGLKNYYKRWQKKVGN